MPLKAVSKSLGRSVYASEVCRDRGGHGGFVCPRCGEVMILRCGRRKIPHFAHKAGHYHGEPETAEHEVMKSFMAEGLRKLCGDVSVDELRVGDSYPDVLGFNCRVGGKVVNIACEVQYSHIPLEEFKSRTTTLSDNGFYVLWVFNALKHLKYSQRKWFMVSASAKRLASWIYHGKIYFLDHRSGKFGVYVIRKLSDGRYVYGLWGSFWGRFPEDFTIYPDEEVIDLKLVKVLKLFPIKKVF